MFNTQAFIDNASKFCSKLTTKKSISFEFKIEFDLAGKRVKDAAVEQYGENLTGLFLRMNKHCKILLAEDEKKIDDALRVNVKRSINFYADVVGLMFTLGDKLKINIPIDSIDPYEFIQQVSKDKDTYGEHKDNLDKFVKKYQGKTILSVEELEPYGFNDDVREYHHSGILTKSLLSMAFVYLSIMGGRFLCKESHNLSLAMKRSLLSVWCLLSVLCTTILLGATWYEYSQVCKTEL